MAVWRRLSRTEKTSIVVAMIGALFFSSLLWNDGWLFSRHSQTPGGELGHISSSKNDLRHKTASSIGWTTAADSQSLRIGDSLYAGADSSAEIDLQNGNRIMLSERSLIAFNEIDQRKVANLKEGVFKIHVDGEVNVAIDGQLTKISGENSEVQINSSAGPGKKPTIRILKGAATLQKALSSPVRLDARISTAPQELQAAPVPEAPKSPAPPSPSSVHPRPYAWRFDDLYEIDGAQLHEKPRPRRVPHPVQLEWMFRENTPTTTYLQHTHGTDFQGTGVSIIPALKHEIAEPFVGDNQWRISADQQTWSETQTFRIETFFSITAPTSTEQHIKRNFDSPSVRLAFFLDVKEGAEQVIVQAGLSPSFLAGETRTSLSDRPALSLAFYRPGVYYYRFRSVGAAGELSDWSQTVTFTIRESPNLPAPDFAHRRYEGDIGQDIQISWSQVPASRGSLFELYTEKGELVRSTETSREGLGIRLSQPGRYRAIVRSINELGRTSSLSQAADIMIRNPQPPPIANDRLARAPARRPASPAPLVQRERARVTATPPVNSNFRLSRFSLEGAAASLQSSQQAGDGTEAPVAVTIGIRAKHWFGRHGAEFSLKSAMFGGNTAGSSLAPKQFESRYHWRYLGAAPLGITREMQSSLFAGIELYRSAGGAFSPSYDLVKFGTALEFPVANRWSTGGEILMGLGTDQSRKYEISGHIGFFQSRSWSAGLGYRIHLFEAGSLRSSPAELPFREGYTEGYSTLQFYY